MWPKGNKLIKKIWSVKVKININCREEEKNNVADSNVQKPVSFDVAEAASNIPGIIKRKASSTSNLKLDHSAIKVAPSKNARSRREKKIWFNDETFCCVLCTEKCEPGNGIMLQQCYHLVCTACIINVIKRNTDVEIKCPFSRTFEKCDGVMLHCEIRSLVSEKEFSNFMNLSLKKHQFTTMDELIQLDNIDAVENRDKFECPICLTYFTNSGEGIVLRNCFHTFCKACLVNTVEKSEDIEITCPFVYENLKQCRETIEQREIKGILSVMSFAKYLQRDLSRSEFRIQNSIHCLTPNCPNFFIVETGDTNFICSVCLNENCIDCKAIHEGITCAEHKDEASGYTKQTMDFINQSVSQKEMMECPGCQNYVFKTGGCNHMTCRCGIEFQWHGME